MVDILQDGGERVAVETATRVHGEWSGFVDDNEGLIFAQDVDGEVDIGFDLLSFTREITFARLDPMIWRNRLELVID